MRFKYIGRNETRGLKKGKVYTIQSCIQVNLLLVVCIDEETGERLPCSYPSLETFFKNWEVKKE